MLEGIPPIFTGTRDSKRVISATPDAVERLSAYSQVPVMTLETCRRPNDLRPKQETNEEISLLGRIATCGGSRERAQVSKGGNRRRPADVDSTWRPTHKEFRVAVLGDISKPSDKIPPRRSGGGPPPYIAGSTSFGPETLTPDVFFDPNDHSQAKSDCARSTAKVDLLVGKLSSGTRRSYKDAWKHWRLLRKLRVKSRWMDLQAKLWGEDLVGWIIHGWHIMHLSAGPISENLSGIRYMHIISGYGDLSKSGGRAGLVLSAIGQRELPNRKLALPSELAH